MNIEEIPSLDRCVKLKFPFNNNMTIIKNIVIADEVMDSLTIVGTKQKTYEQENTKFKRNISTHFQFCI